ncbi:hypothetical protein AMR42_00015 [Limnothrix sp. PR1529]|uniref:hypothetical protein n=1 Tax=Limnothrix sp. PR1529 TaxID=1704291 RepID=UPI00081E5738|nr:hypothetical protein [Limnothrix sp. PR1529]OCQ94057.1 hypothetical protein BCR12_05950 [Limnothrix sp. P13C2]PIB15773.1 hypothetical protein AMR42_00015 [Limnothrix sp. PR1529]
MFSDYGFVDGSFDSVATDNDLPVHLAAESLYNGAAVAVAVNPDEPSLALITPIVGMSASDDAHSLEWVSSIEGDSGQKIGAVYREGDGLSPGLVNDIVLLASRPVTHSILVNAGLLFEALAMFETDQTIEISFTPSDARHLSPNRKPWEALVIARAGGYAGNVAVIAPVSITNTGRCGSPEPNPETLPAPFMPFNPGSLENGERYVVAAKGKTEWSIVTGVWDESAESFHRLGDDTAWLFDPLNPADIPSLHCAYDLMQSEVMDLLKGIPHRLY